VTKHTKLPDQSRKESADPPPFTVGEKVAYKVLVDIVSPLNYSWSHRTGTVQGYDALYELVKIQPDDQNEGIVQVARVYAQPIESDEEEKGKTT